MKIKSVAAAVAVLWMASSASAVTVTKNYTQFSVSFDNSTVFGSPGLSFSSGPSTFGFGWYLPTALNVASVGGATVSTPFSLPDFEITANPGWTLSGPATGFVGNIVFTEVGGATSSVTGSANVSVDGGPASAIGGTLAQTVTSSGAGYSTGFFSGSQTVPGGSFTSLKFTGGVLTLAVGGGSFASIVAQPQNEFKVSFTAVPVPEPETYAMLLAGLGVVALLARRRRND